MLLLPATPLLADDGWQKVLEQDGISIFLRPVTDSPIKEFKGVIRIKSSLDSLAGVMHDNQACPEWVHQCQDPALLETLSFSERYVYQVNDFPFPAANRDIIMHALIEQDPSEGSMTIRLNAAPSYCDDRDNSHCQTIANPQNVHIARSNGHYLLQKLENGWVNVTWQQHIEPGGALPNWMINSMLVDIPFNTLKKLRQLVTNPKYQEAKLDYDSNGIAIGFKVKNW
ncbi:MAG: START domain-containing protein [Motiliproteus sp.]